MERINNFIEKVIFIILFPWVYIYMKNEAVERKKGLKE